MGAIKPYGDSLNDGAVQLSFTLPCETTLLGQEGAKELAKRMGLEEPSVVHMEAVGKGFTFFVVYGCVNVDVDLHAIEILQPEIKAMDFYTINTFIKEKIGRRVKVIGACTGSDAHSTGLDAIMNMKGFSGEYGLERYPEIETKNMGSQVRNEVLIKEALDFESDAILISQVVTQRNVHLENLTQFIELLEVEGLRERFLLIIGGPRLSHELAMELGFDAGFGPGTYPNHVASFMVQRLTKEEV